MLSVLRRVFASGFKAGFVSPFRWIPSELDYSYKGRWFFDRNYHPSKSLLHVLAQRLTRPPPARTSDQDVVFLHGCTWMLAKLIVRLIFLPAVSVQSHALSDDLSSCTGHAAAVLFRRNGCIGGFEKQMSHGSLAPLTWCGLPAGVVGSQFLDESQMQWSSAGSGTTLTPPPDAKRPSKVSPCQKSGIRCPTPKMASCLKSVTMSKVSPGAGTRSCSSSREGRWQRGRQRNQRRKRATACAEVSTGGFWTTTPPPSHAGRSPRTSVFPYQCSFLRVIGFFASTCNFCNAWRPKHCRKCNSSVKIRLRRSKRTPAAYF